MALLGKKRWAYEPMTQHQIEAMISLARGSLGTPFSRRGRDLKKELSCIGLITCAAKPQGVECPILDAASFVSYNPANRPASDAIAKDLQRINTSEARAGDILLFHIVSPGHPLIEHTALITGERPLTIIHATPFPIPEVIEHRLDAPLVNGVATTWGFFVKGAYRFRDYE